MAKAKKFTADDPAQSHRFIEAAKTEGIEDVGPAFRRGLGIVAPAKKVTASTGRKTKRAKRA